MTHASAFPPPTQDAAPGPITPYMQQTRRARIDATLRLRAEGLTDATRWATEENLDAAWERRAVAAAALIPAGSRVLDIGAGREALARHLAPGSSYVPADLVARSPRTVVVDVNAGQFPPGDFDVVTMLGVIEYVHDVRALLAMASTRAPMLVVSYCTFTSGTSASRLQRGWLNDLGLSNLLDLLRDAGWHVAWAGRLDTLPDFDQWVFACRRSPR